MDRDDEDTLVRDVVTAAEWFRIGLAVLACGFICAVAFYAVLR